jgi:hypothetical protein
MPSRCPRATSSSAIGIVTIACCSSPCGWSRTARGCLSLQLLFGLAALRPLLPRTLDRRRCGRSRLGGDAVFIADDLFWNHPDHGLELAAALKRRGVRKRWILVQTRTDLVCRSADLLEEWRPIAKDFDIFFGLEAASDAGLANVTKDTGVGASIEAARISRSLGYGVTGNFLVDPDWDEAQFQELWDFVASNGFQRPATRS